MLLEMGHEGRPLPGGGECNLHCRDAADASERMGADVLDTQVQPSGDSPRAVEVRGHLRLEQAFARAKRTEMRC